MQPAGKSWCRKLEVADMGWETRPGRTRYYTRAKKRGGKVIHEYVGSGPLGELAAAADALQRAQRQAEWESWRADKARWQTALSPLQERCSGTGLLVKATLFCAGFYLHARTSWRKKQHAPHHVSR
jgi:hypothetical protein